MNIDNKVVLLFYDEEHHKYQLQILDRVYEEYPMNNDNIDFQIDIDNSK